jgi:transposase
MLAADNLPNDSTELKQIIVTLKDKCQAQENKYQAQLSENQEQLNSYQQENAQLRELVRLLKHKYFAKKSEVLHSDQLGLFNEAEALAGKTGAPPIVIKAYKRGKPKRKPIPDHLAREEVIIELPAEERHCPEGHALMEIGQEESEQLDIIPAKIKVIKTIRKKYACKDCEGHVKLAPLPTTALPKSMAGPGLLSFIITSKYVDHLPLYRLENVFARSKIEIPRITMARWMIKCGELLQPLVNLLEEDLLDGDYLQCDETRVQVLKEKGKAASSLSYMWVRAREGPEPIVLFDYAPTRSGDVPKELLVDFKGYLQVDGYEGYNTVCAKQDIMRLGCWAHVRRKFFEAHKASRKGQGKAAEAIALIRALYEIEAKAKELSDQARYELRQRESKPILAEIRVYLDQHNNAVPPQSVLGKAIGYTDKQWPTLIRYIEDSRLKIDNNFVENAIRPFALGRKNWLFSDTVAGAKASAILYSLIETAKAGGHEPYDYLRHVLMELPKAQTAEDITALLPYKIDPKSISSPEPLEQKTAA